jgi:hypothetical protein
LTHQIFGRASAAFLIAAPTSAASTRQGVSENANDDMRDIVGP